MNIVKIGAIADLHIGLRTYSKIDPQTHLAYRELEVLSNLQKIIDDLLAKNITVLAISGDIYHSANVSPTLQEKVNKTIFSAALKGMRCIIIDGNHDRPPLGTSMSPLQVFTTLQVSNVIHSKVYREVDIDNIKFVLLPVYATSTEVENYLAQVDKSKQIIVLGHFSVAGAKMNDWLVAENEEYIDLNAFKKDNIKCVILGHLHKPQILCTEPLVFYTGSLQRTDFNEENQEKGYWIIDTSNYSHQFIPIDTLKFYTINDSLIEHSFQEVINSIDTSKVDNAVVRITLEVDDTHKLSEEDEKYLNQFLTDLKAISINLKIKANVVKRVRNESLKEGLTIEQSIDAFFSSLPKGEERAKLAKEIINRYRLIQ